MGMLGALLGDTGWRTMEDFTSRYERGAPWVGIDERETMQHYDRVARQLDADDYREAAQASLARLSPDERRLLVAQLQGSARRTDVNTPGLHEVSDDPASLAAVMARLHQEQPGMLQQLLGGSTGGGGDGLLGSTVAKAALAGIAVMAVKRALGQDGRGGF
jgi:hypothetical protein